MKLSEAKLGKIYKIINLELTNIERRRILDLGFNKEELVTPLYRGLFNNPTAFLIRGSIIALRDDTTSKIIIGDIDEKKDCPSGESQCGEEYCF